MKRVLIGFLFLCVAGTFAYGQGRTMRIYSKGEVLHTLSVGQVDSITFDSSDEDRDLSSLLVGNWIPRYGEVLEKKESLIDNRPGLFFGSEGQFVERMNMSMIEDFHCVDFSGEWAISDSIITIRWGYNDPYNAPKADYQWKIISIDDKSCKYEKIKQEYTPGFSPTNVFIKTKGNCAINQVFEFINSLDHDVEYIYGGSYTSTMFSDNLQYILDCLNAKPYTNKGAWKVTGYLHYQTKEITIFPRLFDMKNKDYQSDWLKSINEFQLIEHPGYIIFFHVPEGKEKEWVEKFKKYDFVEWAELS